MCEKVISAIAILILLASNAPAALWDRGEGLIYDDVLDITWLQDANYMSPSEDPLPFQGGDGYVTWQKAMAWVEQLVYQGYDDWRLPDPYNPDGSGPDLGYDVTGCEMGYMFYNNLGGIGLNDWPSELYFTDAATGEIKSFHKVMTASYWTNTGYYDYNPAISDTLYAYIFNFRYGFQDTWPNGDEGYAWAVRDGDSSSVPIPGAVWLFGTGILSLAGWSRKRKSYGRYPHI